MLHRSLSRSYSTISKLSAQTTVSALKVFENSCYHKIDFKINEESNVKEAVMRFSAFNIGCLVVTDKLDRVVGVCSERDYITKVAVMDKASKELKVKHFLEVNK